MLTANQASIETSNAGWPNTVNCTVTQSTTLTQDQANSLRLSSTASGTMSAETTTGTGGVAVIGSTQYTAVASFQTGVTARNCTIGIQWYTAAGASISTSTSSTVSDTNGSWHQATVTATSPSNAAFAAIIGTVASTGGAAELHYMDEISLQAGAGTTWTQGMAAINQNGTCYIDQPWTTAIGQTTITRISIQFAASLGTGADLTIGLYADTAGVPSGTALASITYPAEFLNTGPAATATSMPMNVTGLTASTLYHFVINGTASSSNSAAITVGVTTGTAYKLSQTGVGGTWTAGTGTIVVNVFNGVNGVIRNIAEDGTTVTTGGIVSANSAPAKWIGFAYTTGSSSTSGPPSYIWEYTGPLRSVKNITYSAGLPTTVA